jgi:MerR family transcriptional regulator, light-induced transcriptional regulator
MADQSQYTISDLAYYSGIKPHTIRIWEKRFNLLCPSRSGTNIRGYGCNELKKLININTLLQSGWKISKAVNLNDIELDTEVRQLIMGKIDCPNTDFLINGLLVHMLKFDEVKFVEVLQNAFDRFGVKDTILQIVYPFLKRIGVLWQVNDISPAQEHFASAIIRRKLLRAIDAMPPVSRTDGKPSFILCLPTEEFHELPLLLAHYILLEHKVPVLYLGASVPPEMAAQSALLSGSTHLFTLFMSASPMDKLKSYLTVIHDHAPDLKLLFSGCPEMCKKPILNGAAGHVSNIEEFEEVIIGLTKQV